MPRKKQTARKTTGKHVQLTSILSRSEGASRPAKRVHYDPLANIEFTPGTTTPRSTLPKRTASRSSPTAPPLPDPPFSLFPPESPNTSLESASVPPTNGFTLTSGTMTRRQSPLDTPISVCIRFASWLETQKCVHDHVLLQAVERDGSHLLSLAKATITFDNALRGNVLPSVNGVEGALGEHARTLRIFAQLLKSKISEGTLSEELEKAVLRDGEALLRLALCCLDFDRVVQGSSPAS